MPKEKVTIVYRIKHWFVYHPWLKIVALILAVILWIFVRDEIGRFNY
ncbi:MAG: hypothetical protein PHO70_02140 [Candidatus Omnitrophica bacterium]|nr:hypothetical protein [Candidatus Omnitrophota bacterium]